MADTTTTSSKRPEKPDDEAYEKDLAAATKALDTAKTRLTAAKAKLDLIQTNNKDSPQGQKQSSLRQEQGEIRKKQGAFKDARTKNQDQIKRLDEKLKALINENKSARSRVNFKSEADIDREIERLQKQVDSGTMKIVDEKKTLTDISTLHRARKSFGTFNQQQKAIDDIKAQISDIKKTGDHPEAKALSDRYNEIQNELDSMKKETDEAFKNINSLRDERTKANEEHNKAYNSIKEIKDKYFQSRRAFRDWEFEQKKARREKAQAERIAYESGKKREVAQQKLEEASVPAYGEELGTAENLIRHFDPSSAPSKEKEVSSGQFAAVASRTIESNDFKGMKIVKKDDDDEYFKGSGGKKKKGKKNEESTSNKFNLSSAVIESLARIGVDPPAGPSHIPIVVTQIKEKIEFWKSDQKRKTDENIAKAKKEIEKLEAETSPSAPVNINTGSKDTHNKPANANLGLNGKPNAEAELQQEKDAIADVNAELEKVKLEA